MHARTRLTRTIRVLALAAAAGTLALAAAACGDDDGDGAPEPAATEQTAQAPTETAAQPTSAATSPAAASVDACALVSKADIEAAIGAPVLDGEPGQAANLYTCSYNDPEFTNISVVGVAVFVQEREGDAVEVYELAKSNAAEVQEVDGIGDEAYWDGVLNSMQILSGTYELSVDVASEEGRDQVAAAKTIGAAAIEALP